MPRPRPRQVQPSEPKLVVGTDDIADVAAQVIAATQPQAQQVNVTDEVIPEWNGLIDPRSGEPWSYPNLHGIIYGEFASGKSSFLATFVKYFFDHFRLPSLIFGFDPPGKMWPYLELGDWYGPTEDKEVVAWYEARKIKTTDVLSAEGELIVRIEHYAEQDHPLLAEAVGGFANPQAWIKFNGRINSFAVEAEGYGLAALDSMTGLIYANLALQRAVKPMHAFEKGSNTMQWWSMATDDVEALITSRLPWWDTNVFMAVHVAEDKEEFAEGMRRGLGFIGRLKKNAGRLYEEVYRMVVVPDTSRPGEHTRLLQTGSDTMWPATTLIAKAPNMCEPSYHALWANWRKKKLGVTDGAAVAVPMKARPVMRRRR